MLSLLALLAGAAFAHAQTPTQVYRCVGAHGEPKFSGQPCGTPLEVPGTGADTRAANHQIHALGAVCPASPQTLRQAIAGAFETHDVNRLAGLIMWRGMDEDSARAQLRVLAAWLKQPLAGITIASATGPPFADADASPASSVGGPSGPMTSLPPNGFQISTGGGDGSTRDFGITESGGCWWLTFQ